MGPVDLVEYCRPQNYTVNYDADDSEGNWDSYVGLIQVYSAPEAIRAADERFGFDWWDLLHEGPETAERIGR